MRLSQHFRIGFGTTAISAFFAVAASAGSLSAEDPGQSLRFFEGRTEMISVVKVIMRKPYRSRTTGRGEILPDGSLALVQLVEEDGKPARQRYWKIRQIDAVRFAGTMSEAVGLVRIQRFGGQFRFNFKLKGNLAVEQWIVPAPGGRSARTTMTARKFGMRVASSEGTIRKL